MNSTGCSRLRFSSWLQYFARQQVKGTDPKGTTLVELLAAGIITSIVVSIVFMAFLTALKSNKKAEAQTRRRTDLSRAFDFISNEIRMASRINQTPTMAVGSGNTLAHVVASSGLNLSDLGGYVTLVLYLEIPIANLPASCPDGSVPVSYDRVVYDLRVSDTDWLSPRSVYRYGRIPKLDGSIDPCSAPISSDVLVDAISDTVSTTPLCNTPGLLSGAEGFHSCVDGAHAALYFESDVAGVEVHDLSSTVSSRLTGNSSVTPVLSGNRQSGTDTMDLAWTWTGPIAIFKVYQSVAGGAVTEVYSGSNLSITRTLAGTSGDLICYTVTATMGTETSSASDPVCETK